MKILITGNMGYVGPCVVRQLRASYGGATLVGLDMGYFAHCLTSAGVLPELSTDVQYFADVRCVPADLLQGVDAVVHLAAVSNDAMGSTFEEATADVNFKASVDIARKAKSSGVTSFVFASSCSMYGLADDTPRTETSPLNPLTAYATSKVRAEAGLQKLADENFSVTCLRFATA
jgi:nucleoside-diphosphate-sugar epimerase